MGWGWARLGLPASGARKGEGRRCAARIAAPHVSRDIQQIDRRSRPRAEPRLVHASAADRRTDAALAHAVRLPHRVQAPHVDPQEEGVAPAWPRPVM